MARARSWFVELLLLLLCPTAGRQRMADISVHQSGVGHARCRRQRRRRRALWLAWVSVDAGPRRLHGVRMETR